MIKDIEINKLFKHPHNPRKEIGDISELAESIKKKGILQNLTVVPKGEDNYVILIGHRRAAAAKEAGLEKVPCAVIEVDEKEQVAIMLLENMQRSDLTVIEQAEGIQMMLDMGDSISEISEKTGFSESTVRRRAKLMELDRKALIKSYTSQIKLEDYDKINELKDIENRNEMLKHVGTANFGWKLSQIKNEEKVKPYREKILSKLEKFAKEIKKSDYSKLVYAGMYVYRDGEEVSLPSDVDTEKYFYVDNKTNAYIYKEKKSSSKNDEAKRKEEQKKNDETRSELDELSARAYSMRREFMKKYVGKTKDIAEISNSLAKFVMRNDYYDEDDIYDLYGIHIDWNEDFEEEEIEKELEKKIAESSPARVIAVSAYLISGDSKGEKYYRGCGEVAYHENEDLDMIYDFLISLGYEMSDEEKELKDGTHRLYNL